ncbi:MAG: alpha/beta hydrolase [Frankiaceae bacterium]
MRPLLRTAAGAVALLLAACTAGGPTASTPPPSGPAGASSATSSAPAGLATFYRQRPRWKGCGDGFQCARITVPLDYAAPNGRSIELAVTRLPAEHGKGRKGSLLLNPGGPGVSGLDYARAAGSRLSRTLRQRFDIVGFDPRGVGKSTPVRCLSDRETDGFVAADASPDTPAEEHRLVDLSKQLGQRCELRNGALVGHVSTREAARDMDVLRAVLGDDKLHYLGASYGTYLGATYAELFPDRVGTLVLDGAVDPAASSDEINREQAVGFEVALRAFVDDCLKRSSCPLPAGRESALAAVNGLLEAIDRHPLRGEPGRPLTQGLAVLGVVAALYDKGSWPLLRLALAEAKGGDGATLLTLADFYTERDQKGHYPTNTNDAIYAINCLDRPATTDEKTVRSTAAQFARVAPRFGAYLAWSSLPCVFWPVKPTATPHPVRAASAAPILVVGTTRDPATPYKWAQALANELESGRLLTYDGDGHTAYRKGSRCIDEAVDRYLVDGRLPAEGARCT